MKVVYAWLAAVAEAFALKLASSVDDVVWFAVFLAPDISKAERTKNIMVYATVCFVQTIIAYVIATSGEMAIDKLTNGGVNGFSSERILTLVAACGLGASPASVRTRGRDRARVAGAPPRPVRRPP